MASIQTRRDRFGKPHYSVQIRDKGFKPIYETFTSRRDAERFCAMIKEERSAKKGYLTLNASTITVHQLIERFISVDLENRPKSKQSTKLLLKYWDKRLGHLLIRDLTPVVIDTVRQELVGTQNLRGKARSPATVNRYLSALSVVLTTAVKDWALLSESPMANIRKLREPRGRVRYLSDTERDALIQACKRSSDPYILIIVMLALSTGMRRGEILSLSWECVDLKAGRIVVEDSKNGDRRSVPLVGTTRTLLEAFASKTQSTEGYLFPGERAATLKPKDIRKAWLAVAKEAELKQFRFHDLRHSCASYLAMSGATLLDIAEVLGHKTLHMVKRYAHLSPGHTHEVLAKMSGKFIDSHELRT